MSPLPKEHGAYGQLAFPIVTALAAGGVTLPAAAIGLAATAGFLAHEPAKVMLGQRGARASRESGRDAARWLAILGALMLGAAVAAWATTDTHLRWSLFVPVVPACALGLAMLRGQEKSSYGEVASGLAFAGVSVPMMLASGESLASALTIAVPFALSFVVGTLAVRVVILRVRGGGDARATAATRRATFVCALAASVGLLWAAMTHVLSAGVLIAALPGLVAAVAIAARPPAPTRLRVLGWTLVGVSVVTAVVALVAVR